MLVQVGATDAVDAASQGMLDFDFMCKRKTPSVCAMVRQPNEPALIASRSKSLSA